jgi:transposase-like protein
METRATRPGGRPAKGIDLEELKRLLDQGRSLRQIAARLRCGYGTVHRAAEVLRSETADPKLSEVIQNPLA